MTSGAPFYLGNAALDQVRETGWFIGQFVPPELGLRHQTDLEMKWGMHPDGDKRVRPWAHGRATTISVLIRGKLIVSFHATDGAQTATLATEGDYLVYRPDVVHSWEAVGETLVLSIRFPSVEIGAASD